jgi:hypothetical protein
LPVSMLTLSFVNIASKSRPKANVNQAAPYINCVAVLEFTTSVHPLGLVGIDVLLVAKVLIKFWSVIVDDENARALDKAHRAHGDKRALSKRRLSENVKPAAREGAIDSELLGDLDEFGGGKGVAGVFWVVVQVQEDLSGFLMASLENEPASYIIRSVRTGAERNCGVQNVRLSGHQ